MPVTLRADISRIVKYAPVELIGRESESALLNNAWAKVQSHEAKRPRVLTFVALGGEGKTSLVAKWAADLGAISCFFERPWSVPSSHLAPTDQALMVHQAGFRLRATGRFLEALDALRTSFVMQQAQANWRQAAISGYNLSETELASGYVSSAIGAARRAIECSDLCGDWDQRVTTRTTLADALFQHGQFRDALALFGESEDIQQAHLPHAHFLCSLEGFVYCELLVAPVERVSWSIWMETHSPLDSNQVDGIIRTLGDAEERANRALEWFAYRNLLLYTALDHLRLGRTALYQVLTKHFGLQIPHSALSLAESHLQTVVNTLRQANRSDHLPRGFLTRAWLRSLAGAGAGPESAQSDLDEAWEIAERGPMKLFLADIHLYRARLFFREQSYPWQSPQDDLAAAEKLINDCGYHRRDEELADAKQAILGQALR